MFHDPLGEKMLLSWALFSVNVNQILLVDSVAKFFYTLIDFVCWFYELLRVGC